jgi:hypothetical protein
MSATAGSSHFPVEATSWVLSTNLLPLSAATISSPFSISAPAGRVRIERNRRWPAGAFIGGSSPWPSHLAPSKRASGSGAFRAASNPIHSAFQSAGDSRPMVQVAGALHSEALLSPSQTRTFHVQRASEVSGAPAYSMFAVSADSTRPESQSPSTMIW